MLGGGDEVGRIPRAATTTPTCQDNEISWQKWDARAGTQKELREFARRVIALRAEHPGVPAPEVLPRPRALRGKGVKDNVVRLLDQYGGEEMTRRRAGRGVLPKCLGVLLAC